ncbi:hypothetical protein BD410DRAFT_785390 [Rickenella mellea]|uniref:Uncharacterized protein n=1 Tax=Rickenella mellea TaxID=50990 RepID=A0A4Y7QCX6_9AGAM|nr:hypothetical protein BD410DRAFT_785390 [Rickenella mellea]
MLLSPATAPEKLPSTSIWSRIKKKSKDGSDHIQTVTSNGRNSSSEPHQLALTRTRLVTLVYGEMETIRPLPSSYAELESLARNWINPPFDAYFALRIPTEFASKLAAADAHGPWFWVDSEESYSLATHGITGSRVEIFSDAPPPPADRPAPPVLEMPASFKLEMNKGEYVTLDVMMDSGKRDMAKTQHGTSISGKFRGELDVVHDGDMHKMEFVGTRLPIQAPEKPKNVEDDSPDKDAPTVAVAKRTIAKCTIHLLPPEQQYCDIMAGLSPHWTLGLSWPHAESSSENRFKFFLRVRPGGVMEHFETETITNKLVYQLIGDPEFVDATSIVNPQNSFAMPSKDFGPHIMKVLELLGLSMQARTHFMYNNIAAFSAHKYIAYRFLSPLEVAAAIDLSVTTEPCYFSRIFLVFRGILDQEIGDFGKSGEKEASVVDWKAFTGVTEAVKDESLFRIFETSSCELL